MRGRWIVNLLLVVLVIALGAAVRRELQSDLQAPVLTELAPEQVSEIALESRGAAAIHLTRSTEGWRMEAPYAAPADEERIGKLVGIAATPVHRSFPQTADAEELGLDPEQVRLTLNGVALRIGDTDPIAQQRYVAIGDQVHLIGDGFQHHLIAPAEDYVDRRLLPVDFQPAGGTLDGDPLPEPALGEIVEMVAEGIEPLGQELSGQLLSIDARGSDETIRFLLSEGGRRWTRLDLKLSYLLSEPPVWALQDEEPDGVFSETATPEIFDP